MKGDTTVNKCLSSRTSELRSAGKSTKALQHEAEHKALGRALRTAQEPSTRHTGLPWELAAEGRGTLRGPSVVTELWQTESTRHGQSPQTVSRQEKIWEMLGAQMENSEPSIWAQCSGEKWDNKLKNWDLVTGTLEHYTKEEFALFSADNRAYKGSSQGSSLTWVNCKKILHCLWGRQTEGAGWRQGDWVGDHCDRPGKGKKARSEAGDSREGRGATLWEGARRRSGRLLNWGLGAEKPRGKRQGSAHLAPHAKSGLPPVFHSKEMYKF